MTFVSGDVVEVDLGVPAGHESGFRRPAVVVTAQAVLDATPSVLQLVPLTTRLRGLSLEVELDPGSANGLESRSAAQCQHVRSVAVSRVQERSGNIGNVALAQIREIIALLFDLP
ncbi:type II toxin-antitoxin system PemK/MazF family toxin [Candidatus Poriferisodalis sp.]|uniref:type II toxin-antitoxin system PemK/MazF family toxin n=1 Tax=Candidatus Poriferisodalis sp. TaxID=3101277 RepID=UPI003B01B860